MRIYKVLETRGSVWSFYANYHKIPHNHNFQSLIKFPSTLHQQMFTIVYQLRTPIRRGLLLIIDDGK